MFTRFLDLPAELRNAIYGMCAEESSPHLIHKPQTRRRSRKSQFGTSHLQLAHVDQQIRAEFLLPYLQKHTWRIRLQDVKLYVCDFLEPARGAGRMVVSLDMTDEVEGDVYALVAFCKKHTDVSINVTSEDSRHTSPVAPDSDTYVSKLQALLDRLIAPPTTAADRTWSKYFDTAIVELIVAIQLGSMTPFVILRFKTSHTSWWYGGPWFEKGVHFPAWMKTSGCPINRTLAVLELSGIFRE